MTIAAIAATIRADSVSPDGHRLTTFEGTFPRWILAEFNTHRAFSRNSASSRAIPIKKQIAGIKIIPATPLEWGRNRPGMQSTEPLSRDDTTAAKRLWLQARDAALDFASQLDELGLHKQWTNRLLEPFMVHTVVFTSTAAGLDNFFAQRCQSLSPLAQPEMGFFADKVLEAYVNSTPTPVDDGGWHTPFILPGEYGVFDLPTRIAVSVARCARVSYLTHDGIYDPENDLKLFQKLVTAQPPHYSPLEHVATPVHGASKGNFDGWDQYRHCLNVGLIRQQLQDIVDGLAA